MEMEMEMEVEGGSRSVGSGIQRLPEECLSHAISSTSPRDACRSEAISLAFRSAAGSDDVWKRFLPPDYANFIARAVDPVEFASMKDLYFRLCDPILIDGGRMDFCVDRETGAKCFILAARELKIVWGSTPRYWRWIHHPESRFSEVAELLDVCWLDIHGKINSRMLSKRTNYSAHLIFKLLNNAYGLYHPPQEVSVSIGAHVSKLSVRLMEAEYLQEPPNNQLVELQDVQVPPQPLDPLEPPEDTEEPQHDQWPNSSPEDVEVPQHDQWPYPPLEDAEDPQHDQWPNPHEEARQVGTPNARQDGWMEILLGEFYNEEGDDGEVNMSLLEVNGGHWKSGLIVQGIEIRPKK